VLTELPEKPLRPIFISPKNINLVIEIGRSEAYELLKNDPTFPKLRRISGRRVAWLVEDLAAWAKTRPVHEVGPSRVQTKKVKGSA